MDPAPLVARSAAPAATARGRRRREAIVDAAQELFDRQGFHATSVDDVGAAAGISGPGVYRHFASKDALLTAVFDRIWRRLRPAVEAARDAEPDEALEGLIGAHVALAVEEPAAITLLLRELRHVPADYQRLARRNHQRYVAAWAAPLRALHPELDDAAGSALALAVHGAIDSAALHPGLGTRAERGALLTEAARRLAFPAPRGRPR